METQKTPFRKNLDKRYISGEDLLNGEGMGKGLKPEMIVTMAKFTDAPAFDQKAQAEVNKTAIYLIDCKTGKMLYKPCLLNVARANFMAKELANGSLYIDDVDPNIPFIMYAKPDRKHGHVVGFKKYILPELIKDSENFQKAKTAIEKSGYTIDQIRQKYQVSSEVEKLLLTPETK